MFLELDKNRICRLRQLLIFLYNFIIFIYSFNDIVIIYNGTEVIQELEKRNAPAIISKPFKIEAIFETIKKYQIK
jgi:hypothetical protein